MRLEILTTADLAANELSTSVGVDDILLRPVLRTDFVSLGVATMDAALAGGAGLRGTTETT